MVDLFFMVATTVAGLIMHYEHQTSLVADSSYPVTPPPASVSVIVPAYNEEAFIERTLLSIKSQNIVLEYPNLFEILVVDNDSEDNTAEIASRYARVVSASPRGVLFARQKGIEEANGEIVVLVDADVILKPNTLNLLLRHYQNPKVVAVGGVFLPINHWSIILSIQDNFLNGRLAFRLKAGLTSFGKEAYYQVGGYDLTINQFNRNLLQQEEEIGLMQRLKAVGEVIVDDQATFWTEARIQQCWHSPDESCDDPFCRYCRERERGERF